MKIFFYALREYDEKKYVEKFAEQYSFEYGFTSDYPSMDNVELAEGYDAISIITNPMYPEILDAFHKKGVKYISTRSIGYEHIDIKYAHSIGMRAAHVVYSQNSVANYAIMLMLMACRNMPWIMKKADCQDYSLKGKVGKELSTSTVGIIGTGNIGKTVVKHLSGFGCRILAYSCYEDEEVKKYAEYVSFDELLTNSDIITLHVPGNAENTHLIDEAAFKKMKDGVIIVNTARGIIVDTQALIAALKSGKVGFAALDTFEGEAGLYYLNKETEKLDNDNMAVLKSFPNVILSPHMAFYTEQAVSDMVENSIKGILGLENGDNSLEVM
jgi:lactate dehydrogenase-like 2-hydroxyacid dehydrogenase